MANFFVDGLFRRGEAFCEFFVVSVEGGSIQVDSCKLHFGKDWQDAHFEFEQVCHPELRERRL